VSGGGGGPTALVHLASGVGNIVLATPLLLTLGRHGYEIDLLVDGDYAETADLFDGWSVVRALYGGSRGRPPAQPYDATIAAIPPFYWPRFALARPLNAVPRPPDTLFYCDEQAWYLGFARALGCDVDPAPHCFLPCVPDTRCGISAATVVLAPGCKPGEMAAKRWPYFADLAAMFADVVVVGTPDDTRGADGRPTQFPAHVRSLVGALSLRETVGVLAAAGVVVANDSGLGHAAGATGTPTILLFGPTPDRTLGRLPPNVRIMRSGLSCEPCWFAQRFAACAGRLDCLGRLTPEEVAAAVGLNG
jgi:ADP-heptose:LPS heptosyltransferase